MFPLPSLAQTNRFQQLGLELDPWAEAQINFWREIYSKYTTHDFIIHDSVNLGRIYDVVLSEKEAIRRKREIQKSLLHISELAKKIGKVDDSDLNDEEHRLFLVLDSDTDPEAYRFAADSGRLRTQLGQKDRLEDAYSISKHYVARMEEMLAEEGVPKELSRLPFVESGFNSSAKSKVGAIGIWQFMPKTAMRDLRVTSAIDERYDPLKATRAAGKFLKRNDDFLKNWGLAVMAYHQGPGLVSKAVNRLKTHDPIRIIKLFKDPNFLFASRNYLFEFLAMNDVDAKHELFFKKDDEKKLPDFITVSFPKDMAMKSILENFKVDESKTKLLNPHFREPIWNGKSTIPAHYPVRLTGITLEEFRHIQYPQK
jgi:membrane-bound lytic murein transglycosylase D